MAPRAPEAVIPLGGDEERLLIEAAKADPRRFAELYERHFDRVYASSPAAPPIAARQRT